VAPVAVLCPDLLFGSKLEGGLAAAGHEVTRCEDAAVTRKALAGGARVLVVDVGAEGVDGPSLVESLRAAGELADVATIGFYPHVDQELRRRAEAAGFDLVVPRSRMAREMGALVERVAPSDDARSASATSGGR
jgi:hypothetical protein